nr:hypothetical protein [Tanacetum cinerariifolium]GFD13887.1 hypothetical protein [Tanacetum cinerariifolium]
GDDDADVDGDDLSEDDADDEDKEESSNNDEDGEESSDSVEEEEEHLALTVPAPALHTPRSRTPLIGTPPLLPIPLPTTSFPLPLLLPSTSGSESIPEDGDSCS